MLNFFSVILSTMFLCFGNGCIAQRSSDGICQNIVLRLKRDTPNANIILSSSQIAFNLSSVSEDVLSKNYIENFKYGNDTLPPQKELVILKAQDSLKSLSRELNSLCVKEKKVRLNKVENNGNDSYILFLSPICSGLVYGELIKSASVIVSNNQYEFFGKAKTFVFLISDKEIEQVYHGSITYN